MYGNYPNTGTRVNNTNNRFSRPVQGSTLNRGRGGVNSARNLQPQTGYSNQVNQAQGGYNNRYAPQQSNPFSRGGFNSRENPYGGVQQQAPRGGRGSPMMGGNPYLGRQDSNQSQFRGGGYGRGRGVGPSSLRGRGSIRGRGGHPDQFNFPPRGQVGQTIPSAQVRRPEEGYPYRTPDQTGRNLSFSPGAMPPSQSPPHKNSGDSLPLPPQKRERKASEVITDIKKSPHDDKDYRILRLQNDLVALLIRDKDAKFSSASLTVNTGALQDPKEYEGLAHFLEHMLFKGSEKYPEEGMYSQFVSMNGGSVNAYTSLFETNYYFNISKEAFYQALDIFAQFYKNPLLKPEAVGKEIHAVHNEFEMNKNDEDRKIFMVKKALADKDSLFNKFTDGNMKTLNKDGVVLALKTFHERHYSSNQMALVISTPDDLDVMQFHVETIFTGIKNKKLPDPDYSKHGFPYKENIKKIVKVAPTTDMDQLELVFNLDSLFDRSKDTKVLQYLKNLLSFEGDGSVNDLLENEGLAYNVKARGEHHKDYFSTFTIMVDLTSEGLKQWEKVVAALVAFINFLKKIGPQKWYFEEAAKMSDLAFKYPEKMESSEMVKIFSAALVDTDDEDLKNFLYKGVDFGEYNEELIKSVTESLSSARCQIFLISDQFSEEIDLQTESYYKGRFKTEDLTDEIITKLRDVNNFEWKISPNDFYKMPLRNFLIPSNFDLVPKETNRTRVRKIIYKKNSEVYHLQDTEFKDPMVCMALQIYENDEDPREFYSPKYFASRLLWTECFKEFFGVETYHARTARCVFDFEQQQKFFHVKGKCFSDSLERFLEELREKFQCFLKFEANGACPISEEEVMRIKEKHIIGMKNSLQQTPYKLGMSQLDWILTDCNLDPQSIINELEKMDYEYLKDFSINTAFKYIRFEWFFEGNINESQAKKYSEEFENSFLGWLKKSNRGNVLTKMRVGNGRPIQLRKHQTAILELPVIAESEQNCCLIKLYEMGLGIGKSYEAQNDLVFATTSFFSAFLRDEYFADLRGRQQLGYIVFCFPKTINGLFYLGFCAQSSSHGSHFLQQKTQEFLAKMNQKIRMMPKEQFEFLKEAIANGIHKPKYDNIDEKFGSNLSEIISHQFIYNRSQVRAKAIRSLELETLLDLWDKKIVKNYRALEIHLYSPEKREEEIAQRNRRVKEEKETFYYENLNNFRLKQGLYPDEGTMLK